MRLVWMWVSIGHWGMQRLPLAEPVPAGAYIEWSYR